MPPPRGNRSTSSSDLQALSTSVNFCGWRFASKNFKSWAKTMSDFHEPTWRQAGIFDAIMASTKKIHKNKDLVLSISEKWVPETNSFLFPCGVETTTITLEDVTLLLGFSVLGLPYSAALDTSGKKIQSKLEEDFEKIKKGSKGFFVNQKEWFSRFMNTGHELEHVAFLVSWLSYFVFPSRYYHHSQRIFPIAVHLSRGTRIALAPPVLAHLYSELSLLSNHIRAFKESTIPLNIDLSALFKLVQVWTWERFKELQPKPNPIRKGETRLARWHDLKHRSSNARQILESIECRKSFPELNSSSSSLEKPVVESGSKMILRSEGGMKIAKDSTNNRLKLIKRVREDDEDTVERCCQTLIVSENDGNGVPSGSKIRRTSEDGLKISKNSTKKRWWFMKRARDKIHKYMKLATEKRRRMNMKRASEDDENTMCRCQKLVTLNIDAEDDSFTIADFMRSKKKYVRGDASKKRTREVAENDSGSLQKPMPSNEETNETGSKAEKVMVLSPNDETSSLDPSDGLNVANVFVESVQESRKTFDDGLDEKFCSEADVVDNDRLAQGKLAVDELALSTHNNEPNPHKKLALGGVNGDQSSKAYNSNIKIIVGDKSQGQDCFLHDNSLGGEGTVKSNEQFENLYRERWEKLRMLALSVEEGIIEVQRKVEWLKETRAMKQGKIDAARLI